MLAEPPALRALVAKDIGYRVEPQRETKLTALGSHHARYGRGHLGAQRHLALPAVNKRVRLLVDYFFTCFAPIQFGRFQNGGSVLDIAHLLGKRAACRHEVVKEGLLFGIKIAYALVRV